jgi:hypothetical protein
VVHVNTYCSCPEYVKQKSISRCKLGHFERKIMEKLFNESVTKNIIMMLTPPPSTLAVMVGPHILSSEQEFFSTQNLCHMDL